jgi:hypothetical protein
VSLPKSLAWLFPEHALRDLDAERDARLVLARLLEHGRLQDVRWAVKRYGLERIHRFFREESSPELSARTIGLWRVALGARDEPWATSRRSQLRSAAPWPD